LEDSPRLHRVLQQYLHRLRSAVVRSPLLDATVNQLGRGRKLDLTYLNEFGDGLSERILHRIVGQEKSAHVSPQRSLFDEDDEEQIENVQ